MDYVAGGAGDGVFISFPPILLHLLLYLLQARGNVFNRLDLDGRSFNRAEERIERRREERGQRREGGRVEERRREDGRRGERGERRRQGGVRESPKKVRNLLT